jgi:two-component system nitrate/nitrite sensor histidine kinase NarX
MLQPCGVVPPNQDFATDAGEPELDADLRAPIERVLRALATISDARAAVVRTVLDDGSEMDLIAASGASSSARNRILRADADCGVCGSALQSGAIRVAAEACACARELSCGGGADHRVVAVALRHKEKACGVLSLFLDRPGAAEALSPGLMQLLPALGDLIGTAMENTRRTEVHVRSSVMQERHMLANEVHDSLAQNLASIRMRTSLLRHSAATRQEGWAVRRLQEIDRSVAQAQARVREIITQFRARMEAPRLLPALQCAVEELRAASGVPIELDCSVREPRLSPYEEAQVFYIAREALTNALKHSGASRVRVALAERSGGYELRVEDDGVGLEGRSPADHGHFGLSIMRERAQRIGATIELQRCERGGTRVLLTLPLHPSVSEALG